MTAPRLTILALAALPAFCADWNPRLAADYLDSRQKEWFDWAVAKAPGGPCVSCHTGATYLLARPALRRALGEAQPTRYETGLLDALRARVDKTEAKDVFPSFTKEPRASQAMGVESIHAALFLGTAPAFERLWALQKDGAWEWFSLDLDPYEMPESKFYGASLAAMAAGSAAPEHRKPGNTAALTAYLQREYRTQPLHNRLMLLWAAGKLPEALPKSMRDPIVDEVLRKQQPDGGWTIEALGPWKARPAAPPSSGSNAYATSLAALALQKSGVPRSDPKLTRALDWLKTHQGADGSWDAMSLNKRYEPGSQQIRFMRDAATAFAVLALLETAEASPRRH